jgi:hypothetical protein
VSVTKHIQTVTKVLTKITHIFSFPFTANIVGPDFADQTHNIFFSWEDFWNVSSAVNKILIIICVSGINKTVIFIGLSVLQIRLHKRIRRTVFWFAEIWLPYSSSQHTLLWSAGTVYSLGWCWFYSLIYLLRLSYVLLGRSTSWLLNGEGVTWSS